MMEYLNHKEMKAKKKLTKSQRRIIVIKDALAQIRSNKLIPRRGVVVDFLDRSIFDRERRIDAKPLIEELFKTQVEICNTCARGALLISTIHKENNFQLCDFEIGGAFDPDSKTDTRLLELFSERQLAMIEEAFEYGTFEDDQDLEGSIYHYNQLTDEFHFTQEELRMLHEFHEQYLSDEERLIAILKNMLKNRGIFKP